MAQNHQLRVEELYEFPKSTSLDGLGERQEKESEPENAVEGGGKCGSTKGKDDPNISTIRVGDRQLIQSAPGVWGMGARTAGSRGLVL